MADSKIRDAGEGTATYRMALSSPNQHSTKLSQLEVVGTKCGENGDGAAFIHHQVRSGVAGEPRIQAPPACQKTAVPGMALADYLAL